MQLYLTSTQVREAEKKTIAFGIPSEVLMKRAGRALADEVQAAAERLGVNSALIVCGTGNNGGDGLVCARELVSRGLDVSVFAFDGDPSPDCRREKKRYTGKYAKAIGGKLIVDCMFGTGLNRKLIGEWATAVKKINSSKAYVISADLPSGLDGDNGEILGVAVKADLTVAFGFPKIGCVLGEGIEHSGKIVVKDIGVVADEGCAYAAEEKDIAAFYPPRRRNCHKGDFGKACIVAGSEEYLGAAALALSSAVRSGCGYIYAVVPESMKALLAAKFPQCIFRGEPELSADCIAVGMGMGCNQHTYALIKGILSSYKGKVVIDADGLNSIAEFGKDILKQTKAKILLTPHVGEMARLTGLKKEEIVRDPIGVAKAFAAEYNVTVHLKNAVSVTADFKKATVTSRGSAALAQAGSGDILSGLIAGNAARGLTLHNAAVCSQYILGMSGEICSEQYTDEATTAKELAENICTAIKHLTKVE